MKYFAKNLRDHKITSYYHTTDPHTEKFLVSSGVSKISVHKTYEDAIKMVTDLSKDPWHNDRKNKGN